jgi:hypothetical protein
MTSKFNRRQRGDVGSIKPKVNPQEKEAVLTPITMLEQSPFAPEGQCWNETACALRRRSEIKKEKDERGASKEGQRTGVR